MGVSKRRATIELMLLVLLSLAYAFVVLRTAWLSDDSFITFRALDNLRHGYGLGWNADERVMGFTHPLWALLVFVPMACGLEAYPAAMAISLVCSAAAVTVVVRSASTRLLSVMALAWLVWSSAYVDFSTSGLENPLAHLLLALFFARFAKSAAEGSPLVSFALAGLVVCNRIDHGLLVLPALLAQVVQRAGPSAFSIRVRPVRQWLRPALVGFSPFLLWTGFAVIYYGFPVPNTAYAKLNTSIGFGTFVHQGLLYLRDSLGRDPLTLLTIVVALALAARKRSLTSWATGLGVLLYLLYILRIGGDFMSGRFLTAPFLVSVVWLTSSGLDAAEARRRWNVALAGAFAVLGIGFLSVRSSREHRTRWGADGISDERVWYHGKTGLTKNWNQRTYESYALYTRGLAVRNGPKHTVTEWNVGFFGYAAGPKVHVIDVLALTEPLLARIPFSKNFRIGHFPRKIPKGYLETVRDGKNQIVNPCLHRYYDKLSVAIHGPLFTVERFKTIWALNTGRYDDLVRKPCPDA